MADFRVARLAFSGQISKIWPRFKLTDLQNWVGLLTFFDFHLNLAGLKNVFGLLALFWPFLLWSTGTFFCRKTLLFHFFGNSFANFCDKYYIRCADSGIISIWGMRDSKLSFYVIICKWVPEKMEIAIFSYRRMYRYFRVKKAKKELKGQNTLLEMYELTALCSVCCVVSSKQSHRLQRGLRLCDRKCDNYVGVDGLWWIWS